MSELLLEVQNLSKTYGRGAGAIAVLKDVNFTLEIGEIVALSGQSGSGKSTLLHCLGLLDQPDEGVIKFKGKTLNPTSQRTQTRLRRHYLGFVYQFHHLQPEFSATENVMIPQMIAGVKKTKARSKAQELLTQMGLEYRLDHRPATLSGGEQQRVAIARALANDPAILIADEPTGNLDTKTSDQVFDLLTALVRERGMAALIATHNPLLAKRMDREYRLENGQLSG